MATKKVQSTEYIDPSGGLTNRELEIGSWYVRHIEQLKRFGLGLIIAWSVGTIGYSLWGWGSYLIFGYSSDQKLLSDSLAVVTNYRSLQSSYSAKPLTYGDTQVFRSGRDKYDIVTDVSNANERWVAEVTYRYTLARGATATSSAVVLPGGKRPIASFGFSADQFPTNAQLDIVQTRWVHLNAHLYKDVPAFLADRLKFSNDVLTFHAANSISGVAEPSVRLTLSNDSAYSYWQPVFYVDLFNGTSRVGVVAVTENQFRAGDARTIDVRLFGDTPIVTDVMVTPVINIFDPSVFMKPGE